MMSRQEKSCPTALNTGLVSPTIQAMVDSSARRMISARLIPSRRAFLRLASGSLLERIATNTRLSIPSTTSMTTRVSSASQAVGSARSWAMLSMGSGYCGCEAGPL